jgi:hypothetical protein
MLTSKCKKGGRLQPRQLVLVSLSALLFSLALHAKAASNDQPLQPAYKTVMFTDEVSELRSAPYFDKGFLVQVKHLATEAGTSNVFLYNSAGLLAHKVQFWPAGAKALWISWAAVGSEEKLAIGAQVTVGDGSHKNSIIISDFGGNIENVIPTGRFIPMQVAVGPDSSLWAVGTIMLRKSDPPSMSSFDVLRHYSESGKLLGRYLPQTELSMQAKDAWRYSSGVYMRATGDGIVVYDNVDRKVFKYVVGEKTLQSWVVAEPALPNARPTGFGVTTSGRIYSSLLGEGDRALSGRGLYELVLNGRNGGGASWELVEGTQVAPRQARAIVAPGSFLYLLGCDGEDVVYRTQDMHPFPVVVSWSRRQ